MNENLMRQGIQYKAFQNMNLIDKSNTISFIVFCLFMIDCAISGGGHWLLIGPFSLRMILGFIALIFAFPVIIINLKQYIVNPMVISLVLFVVYVFISAYIGWSNDNSLDIIFSDIKGYGWLLLVPVALAVVNSQRRLIIIMKCIIVSAIIQAIIIIIINIVCSFSVECMQALYPKLNQLQFGFIDPVTSSIYRIFFKSSLYMVVSCIFMVYFQMENKKINLLYVIGTGLCLVALLFSFTRSTYGAVFIALVLTTVLYIAHKPRISKKLFKHIILSIMTAIIVIVILQTIFNTNYIYFAVARTLSINIVSEYEKPGQVPNDVLSQEELKQLQKYIDRTKNSDNNVRATTVNELSNMIGQNPVFGNGLGATITSRSDGLVEYFYYDILNKMGLFGFVLYYFPIGYMVSTLVMIKKSNDRNWLSILICCFCGLTPFLAATFFNPYMNSSLGISYYSFCIAAFWISTKYRLLLKK